ncbi:RING-H2 finger protein ATL51-like, partial [Rhagoletis pomonella]|uniref:RING-H2 finger protein ATL51-like n=1 Tax=Rhagoletis pomonella TaxID=28610 RepID=UPI0017862E18
MPLSQSKEDRAQANGCTRCRNEFFEGDDNLKTACSHQFHRICLLDWLKHSSTCPQCRARCNSRGLPRPGPLTRSQVTSKTTSDNPQPLTNLQKDNSDIAGATCLPLEAPVREQNSN